jgi:hypothetical protein
MLSYREISSLIKHGVSLLDKKSTSRKFTSLCTAFSLISALIVCIGVYFSLSAHYGHTLEVALDGTSITAEAVVGNEDSLQDAIVENDGSLQDTPDVPKAVQPETALNEEVSRVQDVSPDVANLKKLFDKHAHKNTVIIIPVNSDYLKVFKVLLCSVSQIGDDYKLVLSMITAQSLDPKVLEPLQKLQTEQKETFGTTFGIIPYSDVFDGVDFHAPGSYAFNAIMFARGAFLKDVTATGYGIYS